ncbi:MAG: 5-bromo-4-chloroindolyl phosphate hydrolysis family protein [Oscillospiraceae bacterium]|nr:5-bromo-4-chloroindolyl phosphate hydrolysis family protein [Oscillospiraceae bacterium]
MATVKKVRKSAAPYYGMAAVWVVWALLFDLYKASHFVFVAILSVGVFMLLRSVCKDEVTETEVPDPPKEAEKPTGNAELDKMISDGQKAISEMKRLDDAIADEKISQDIRRLEGVCQMIFNQVKEDPAKLPQIRQFMDYYLPTTLKLLNAYDRMDSAGISGENVTSTKEKVENIMGTIVIACEKQLDSLYGQEALDISTDISVLETILAREGLAGDRMEAQTTKNADGTDIKLEL